MGSGGDKNREVGRGRGLLGSGDDKSREVGRSRGLLGSGGDKSREIGRSRELLGSGRDKSREVINHVRRLQAGWCGRVFGGTESHRERGAPYYRRILGGRSRQGLSCRGTVRRSV